MIYRLDDIDSSLIKDLEYDDSDESLSLWFRWGGFSKHYDVPQSLFDRLILSDSVGNFYNNKIKQVFSKTKKQNKMAESKKERKIINVKINVDEIEKAWLFQGEKGRYLNCTILFSDEKDTFGNNGMIVQQVPKEIYKKNNKTQGPILGNCSVFEKKVLEEEKVGTESGKMLGDDADVIDDLPF